MTAEGLLAKALPAFGRLPQSIAFLSAPGMPRLYSGVTKSRASLPSSACLKAFAGAGKSAS